VRVSSHEKNLDTSRFKAYYKGMKNLSTQRVKSGHYAGPLYVITAALVTENRELSRRLALAVKRLKKLGLSETENYHRKGLK
jgi:hypothetical protein